MTYFQKRGFVPRTILFILRFIGLKKKYSRRNSIKDMMKKMEDEMAPYVGLDGRSFGNSTNNIR